MKKLQIKPARFILTGLVLAGSDGWIPEVKAAEAPPVTVAVLDFQSGEQLSRDAGATLAALISARLSAESNLILVERAEIEKLLAEQELGLSGSVTAKTAAEVNRLTGAKILVTGRVFSDGAGLTAVAKVMGVETSRVYGEMVRKPQDNAMSDIAEDLAAKIFKRISEKTETLIAKVVPKEQRIANLVKALPKGKRPWVAVSIPERHFGRQVIDPAAATEMLMILDKAGFLILDKESNKRPDIEIKGEAFSAFAMRKGNLVSCKARIEVKVRDLSEDKLLEVDRQTSVAVDITEQTAAKAALEQAVLDLAERILPKLL